MGSFIRSSLLLALAAGAQAAPGRRATDDHLARDLRTLHKFRDTVTLDPNNTLSTWTGADVCKFENVLCQELPDGKKGLTRIAISGAELGAGLDLKGVLDKLTDLNVFRANSNGFVGTVPDLSKLVSLIELDLSNNQLSGPFPTTVFKTQVANLDIRFNAFSGELPAELFQPTSFQGFPMYGIFANNNQFSGDLPEFGTINCTYITLANNQFTGPIPSSIANVGDLKGILLLGNQLTGTVPEEICALDLEFFDVSDNKLDRTLGPKCQALAEKGILVV